MKEQEVDELKINPLYDYPRLKLLFVLLEKKHGISVSDQRAPKIGPHAMDFELSFATNMVRLSLHESTGSKGFWGLREASLQFLQRVDRWILALLLLRKDKHMANGWLITKDKWLSMSPLISVDKKGAYKINRYNLNDDEKLSGIEAIGREIARYTKLES
jgi:hypothetical protein